MFLLAIEALHLRGSRLVIELGYNMSKLLRPENEEKDLLCSNG